MGTITETFHILLQKGIEGGFAPPTPNARYTVTRAAGSGTFTITTQVRPGGTPSLQPGVSQELQVADYVQSIARLQAILREIPVQYPGAEDLYGRNTSIVQVTGPADLHISGSAAGRGIPYPTEAQRTLFDEAVAIIEQWGVPRA